MRKVVNGKIYDTEKAECICAYQYCNGHDFRNEDTGLYITKKGNFFLAGDGSCMSRWAKSDGNTTTGGSGIIPLDVNEALEFAERYGEAGDIEKYFPKQLSEA
jgi:hypothetical protein